MKPFVDVLPNPYVRFSVIKGDSDSQDVILVSEEKTFKPTVAEAAQPYVKAEIAPAGEKDKIPGHAGEQYRLQAHRHGRRARGPPERPGAHHDGRRAAAARSRSRWRASCARACR